MFAYVFQLSFESYSAVRESGGFPLFCLSAVWNVRCVSFIPLDGSIKNVCYVHDVINYQSMSGSLICPANFLRCFPPFPPPAGGAQNGVFQCSLGRARSVRIHHRDWNGTFSSSLPCAMSLFSTLIGSFTEFFAILIRGKCRILDASFLRHKFTRFTVVSDGLFSSHSEPWSVSYHFSMPQG